MPQPPSRIAVTGATGYIGGRLIPVLLDAGHPVRCLVRSPEKLRDRIWASRPDLEILTADLADPATLTQALQGCDAAFYLVHSMTSAGADYAESDRLLALSFAQAAKQARVARIIYLGGLGETGSDLSAHLASRREVETALASTNLPVTVLRAAMIIGSGSASFEILRYLVERLPVMITPKWVDTPCQPIAVRNVVAYLAGTLAVPETIGGTFDIGGPDALPYLEIMRIMAEELGLPRRRIIPVPVLTPRLSSYWIHLVTPLSRHIAKPLAEGLRNPVVCREHRIATLIPLKLLTVREAIHAALDKMAAHQVETNWAMAGSMPGDPDWAGGTVFRDERTITVPAPANAVFRAFCKVGGVNGWYAVNWMWRLRGILDIFVGGPGLRRGRRDAATVSYGEALDFWRVVGVEPDRSLALRAEMRLPGVAMLEFIVEDQTAQTCTLRQLARFKPRGLLGLLYWWCVAPFHHIVFNGMLRGIAAEAVRLHTASPVAA
jgi:uncharacterized protein YbjT (DUF2867 family)